MRGTGGGIFLPQVFSVGASVRSGHGVGLFTVHGGGRLTVASEAIVFEPDRLTRSFTKVDRLVHSPRSIVMLKGRWLPPFINTRLIIEDGDIVVMASLPGWSRRRLRQAVRDSGFDLQERYGWSSSVGTIDVSDRQPVGEPGTVPEDPGWGPAFRKFWRLLIPFLGLRELGRSESSEVPVTTLRRSFVAYCSGLLLLAVVFARFRAGQPADRGGMMVGTGLLVVGIGAVAAVFAMRARRLECQETMALVRSYSQRVFVRLTVAHAPAVFGFVGFFGGRGIWPYLFGLGLSAIAYAAAAPTASDIRRHDGELEAAGCPHSLRAGIYSRHRPN